MRRETTGAALGLALVVPAILAAGLAPFDFLPPNRASWVAGGAGLRFEAGGIALSREQATWETRAGPARFALTLEVEAAPIPAEVEPRDLLVLADELRVPAFRLRQQGADLIVADRVTNADGERWYNEHRVSRVFAAGERRRIRLVGSDRLAVFVDGERAATTGGYPIPVGRAGERLAGRLLLGTGPDAQTPWTGTFFALTLEDGPETLARYAFAQDEGRTVRSHARAGLDLDLPPHFLSLRRPLGHVATGAADVLVNLLGFVPFGYLLAVRLRGRARLLLLVAGAGFALSLAIELAQSLTVARRSSLEDLGLNTLGTWVGAACALHVGRLRRRSDASG